LIEALAGLIPSSHISARSPSKGRTLPALTRDSEKSWASPTFPKIGTAAVCCSDFSLAENTILGVHYRRPAVSAGGVFLDEKGIQRRTAEVIRDFDVRPPNAALPARALSGGNQQKLIIGREFGLPPKFLLVSQPTRGVDIGAIEFIHRKIVALRDAGCAVLLVSGGIGRSHLRYRIVCW
jgi:simple sugar transport system ATP-binding protein